MFRLTPKLVQNCTDAKFPRRYALAQYLEPEIETRVSMLDSTPANFQHRTDRFGNFDSICKRCFLIVASAREEEELAASETAHICSPIRIFAIADGAIPQIFTIVEEVFGTEPERSGSRVRRLDGPRADSRNIGL